MIFIIQEDLNYFNKNTKIIQTLIKKGSLFKLSNPTDEKSMFINDKLINFDEYQAIHYYFNRFLDDLVKKTNEKKQITKRVENRKILETINSSLRYLVNNNYKPEPFTPCINLCKLDPFFAEYFKLIK